MMPHPRLPPSLDLAILVNSRYFFFCSSLSQRLIPSSPPLTLHAKMRPKKIRHPPTFSHTLHYTLPSPAHSAHARHIHHASCCIYGERRMHPTSSDQVHARFGPWLALNHATECATRRKNNITVCNDMTCVAVCWRWLI